MPALSGSNNNGNCGKQYKQDAANVRPASNNLLAPSTKQAEANIEKSVSSMVETSQKLEQDDMEGVDEKEWGKNFNHELNNFHGPKDLFCTDGVMYLHDFKWKAHSLIWAKGAY